MGFKAHQRQWEEIQDLKGSAKEKPKFVKALHPNLMHRLSEAKSFTEDPEEIKKREELLDEINIFLIQRKIKRGSTKLSISSIGLTRFPARLLEDNELSEYWQSLTTLDLSGNKIRSLPDAIGALMNLEDMSCNSNKLSSLPDSIGRLMKLQKLYASYNELLALPDTIDNLSSLETLNFRNNRVRTLPSFSNPSNLKALAYVDCSDNLLEDLPQWIEKLPALRILQSTGNLLRVEQKEMPQGIELLQMEEIIALKKDPLLFHGPKLKPELKKLLADPPPTSDPKVIIERFELLDNYHGTKHASEIVRIVTLPQWKEIIHFKEKAEKELSFFYGIDPKLLQELQSAQMTKDPMILEQRDRMLDSINIFLIKKNIDPKSKELNLANKGLTRFPAQLLEDDIGYWGSLKKLNISGNRIRTLPEKGLGNLKNLTQLNCSENVLNFLPKTIGSLVKLKSLFASCNNLIGLPDMSSFPGLKWLACQGNPLKKLPNGLQKNSEFFLECDEDLKSDPQIPENTTFYPKKDRLKNSLFA